MTPHRRAGRRARSSSRPWSAAFVLAPFMIVGGWLRRRSTDFGPFFVYAAILFAFSALVSAVHVPGRHVHPLGRRARAVQLHPRARGHRRRGRLGRRPTAGLGREAGHRGSSCGAAIGVRGRCAAVARLARRSTRPGRPAPTSDRRRSRTRSTRPARPRATGSCRSTPSGTKYWTGHGGVVLVNDPLDTDPRGRHGLRHPLAGPRPRRCRSARSRPILDGEPLPGLARPADHDARASPTAARPSTRSCRPRPRRSPVTRREAVLSAVGIFAVALVVRVVFARPDRLPEARGHGLLRRRRAQPRRGPRPRLRRAVELPDAAARVPAAGLRGLAAAPDVPRRDPDGVPRRDASPPRRWSSVVVGAIVPVLAWRLAADVADGARPAARAAPGRSPSAPGLTAAVYLPLLLHSAPARLDDAVRGPGPRRLPADDADRAATRAAPGWLDPRVIGLGVAHRPGRADPQRGDLARPGLGHRGWRDRRPGPRGPAPAHRRSRRRRARSSSLPWAIRDWLVFGSPLPGPGRRQRVLR